MEDLQHFCHEQHPLVFKENERSGIRCYGCTERVYGPSYWCKEEGCPWYVHHKSCAELPLGLHHPLHPKHPLILFPKYARNDVKEYSKCVVCKEEGYSNYRYCCSRCDFNLHIRCADLPLTMESEVHDHPLTRIWKLDKFTCDLCGKGGDVTPYLCVPCNFWTHKGCASAYLRRVKVIRHKHPLDLTHSLEVHQSDSRFCQICVQKVDTDYGLYYCSRCDFVAHLDCAMDKKNREKLKDENSTEQSVDLAAFEVKKHNVGKDGTKIATEIKHFSHEHDLKLSDEVQNNKICYRCVRAIHPPFYSCGKCNFFLHKSCVELPKRTRHPLHQHSLTLITKTYECCNGCWQCYNGFSYSCDQRGCRFDLDVQCSLMSDILTHEGHEHGLILSNTPYKQTCNGCDSKSYNVFRCTTCEFALDFRCATLQLTARYEQHEHPFILNYTAEDDSGEYYCDICEKERNSKHWFYYCKDCSYPAHPEGILGIRPKCKFGGAYKFDCHPHPLTFIEETRDHPLCDKCSHPCEELIYQCAQCNYNWHYLCVYKT